ncbi:DUF726 domain-containing protein [Vibrio cortegadensis]|uniref:DUF726 domain-containing protein n=1 Tax=Vibrio cortegadensis TaxID=1328770 RepID=UPI0021C2B6FD|nr:DUF726 domain-containing protein [Vibrio cortegadensis]MDN3696174.1 DUF726 domain-containing protein [Vibrio cortegadensis]
MFNKFKASLPSFDINPLLKSLKDSLTEPSAQDLEPRDEESCELVQVREGKLPVVFIINGFLSENSKCSKDWLEVVDELYPTNKVIRVDWKAGNLTDMVFDKGAVPNIPASSNGKLGFAAMVAARSSILGIASSVGAVVVDKVAGHWKTCFHETRHVGRGFASYLEQQSAYENCILMGHSLGGRIVRHTLNELTARNLVSVAYIFAGAVSSEDEQWQAILDRNDNLKLINCTSQKDYVLKSSYKLGTLWDHEPAGLSPVMDLHCHTLNLDVTKYAQGHTEFKQKELGQYLKSELSLLEKDKLAMLHISY